MKIEDTLYWQAKKLYVARMRLANELEKIAVPVLKKCIAGINNAFFKVKIKL